MEELLINKSSSVLICFLALSCLNYNWPPLYPHHNSSNAASFSSVLTSEYSHYNYQYQLDHMAALSGTWEPQALSAPYDNKWSNLKYQVGRHANSWSKKSTKLLPLLTVATLNLGLNSFSALHLISVNNFKEPSWKHIEVNMICTAWEKICSTAWRDWISLIQIKTTGKLKNISITESARGTSITCKVLNVAYSNS
jgi:hypothetical protein